jgi:DNA-directed RNA polymerase specialized sigma24 family protein
MSTHILEQEWPEFLDRLDSDPSQAFEEFYLVARKLLSVCPPRILAEIPRDIREDVVHDIILSCCRDDFHVLRRYRRLGQPFALWFSFVARNKVRDRLRTRRGTDWLKTTGPEAEADLPDREASPARVAGARVLYERVKAHVEILGEICKILLLGAAEGRRPRDLVGLLGWPDSWNKKASDELRRCRRRLRRRLEAEGLDLRDVVESW